MLRKAPSPLCIPVMYLYMPNFILIYHAVQDLLALVTTCRTKAWQNLVTVLHTSDQRMLKCITWLNLIKIYHLLALSLTANGWTDGHTNTMLIVHTVVITAVPYVDIQICTLHMSRFVRTPVTGVFSKKTHTKRGLNFRILRSKFILRKQRRWLPCCSSAYLFTLMEKLGCIL